MNTSEQRAMKPANNSAAASSPIGSPRNFVLACIGLASLLADEVPALLERSVRRGSAVVEQAQAEAKRHTPPETPPPADEFPQDQSQGGPLTHHDFEQLLQHLIDLEQHIDELAAQRSAAR
jgi:hypothetical protein